MMTAFWVSIGILFMAFLLIIIRIIIDTHNYNKTAEKRRMNQRLFELNLSVGNALDELKSKARDIDFEETRGIA